MITNTIEKKVYSIVTSVKKANIAAAKAKQKIEKIKFFL